MIRDINLSEVSDGHLYTAEDLAKTDCNGCKGCSECCAGMEETIVLDPYDIFNLCLANVGHAQPTFEGLLASGHVELKLADGLILPMLSMSGETGTCHYLDSAGRCSIHTYRPGICRLFPMARIYEEGSDDFHYFLQVHECPAPKSKIRIRKWIGIPNFAAYERFVSFWHHVVTEARQKVAADPAAAKAVSMEILTKYYLTPYDLQKDFFEQVTKR